MFLGHPAPSAFMIHMTSFVVHGSSFPSKGKSHDQCFTKFSCGMRVTFLLQVPLIFICIIFRCDKKVEDSQVCMFDLF